VIFCLLHSFASLYFQLKWTGAWGRLQLNDSIHMSSTTEEIIRVCEALPSDKQSELADFARFLLSRQDDEAWERRLADPKARPRLEVFLRDSAAEGDEPLDPGRL
jgi:hypothetical protein